MVQPGRGVRWLLEAAAQAWDPDQVREDWDQRDGDRRVVQRLPRTPGLAM